MRFVGAHFLFRRVHPHAHDHQGRTLHPGRLSQISIECAVFVRDLDPLAGRVQIGQRQVSAFHGFGVCRLELLHVVDENELGEVVEHPGRIQVLRGRNG